MKFRPTRSRISGARPARGGFTLVEVLAALVFMAIVIPTAVHGLRVANEAGQVGHRKAIATRVAEQTINELVVTRQWQSGGQRGTVRQGPIPYEWQMRLEPWLQQNLLRLLTVEVSYEVQGREHRVRLSTIVDSRMQ